MATKTKQVKLEYFTLGKEYYKSSPHYQEGVESFFEELQPLLAYISRLAKQKRFYALKDNKFCFLSSYSEKEVVGSVVHIQGSFISARNKFRPDLINRKTGEERPNPKTLEEGDIEKSHFAIKIDKERKEIAMIKHYNHFGITMNNFVNYLTNYEKQRLAKKENKKDYRINYFITPRTDFFEFLKSMSRSRVAEIVMDKSILGGPALNFSDKTVDVREEIKLIVPALSRESIKSFAIDVYNKLSGKGGAKNNAIKRLRIHGTDEHGNESIIDTSFMGMSNSFMATLDATTGEIITSEIVSELTARLKQM